MSSTPRPVVLQAFCPPPFREPTRRSLIVCVRCEHWTHTSTELTCGEGRTNCWYAMVPLRGVCLLLSRPSVSGLWMPFALPTNPLISPRLWVSRLTPLEVWRPPRPSWQVSLCRTSATHTTRVAYRQLCECP